MRLGGLAPVRVRVALVAACAAVVGGSAVAAAAFSPAQTYAADADAQSVMIADATGDRRPDVLLTDPSRLLVFAQRPNGSIAAPTAYPTAGTTSSEWNAGLAVADFNHDGHLDAAVASKAGVQFFLGRRGRLAPGKTVSLPFAATTVAAADLNGDGRPDLVVSGRIEQTTTPELYLLWNRRHGWQAQKLDDRWDTAIRFADLDGDRKHGANGQTLVRQP